MVLKNNEYLDCLHIKEMIASQRATSLMDTLMLCGASPIDFVMVLVSTSEPVTVPKVLNVKVL